MKTIKQIDFYIQALLLTSWLITACFKLEYVFYFYFIVGSWHLISLIFYWVKGSQTQESQHKIIRIIVIVLVGLVGLAFLVMQLFYIIAIATLLFSPILAVYYSCICYLELRNTKQRPLAQLK